MLNSDLPSPNREQISEEYGFAVPDAFVTVVQLAYQYEPDGRERERRNPISYDPRFFYEEVCNLILGPDCRYQQTPPELFPIGNMGVDGVHYGYIIHAPELERTEYPIGELCPMDSGGVFLVGNDTREAFDNLLSWSLMYWQDKGVEADRIEDLRNRVNVISRALQISPDAAKGLSRYGSDGNGWPILPETAEGWRHELTSDGIGVLAEKAAFAPGEFLLPAPYADAGDYLAGGNEALSAGFPATALAWFREGFWYSWTAKPSVGPLAEGMCECYRRLGRPRLADIAERNVASITDVSP